MKERLDVLFVKRGLAESREKAKAIIMSGIVYVEDQKEDKAGTTFDENAKIEVRGSTLKYVSRGGLKLEKAMTHFGVTLDQKVCMDVGASTGGFTDCMLQNGAVKEFSVDVGHGQLAWNLRNDPACGLHGEDKHPLCDTGGYRRAGRFLFDRRFLYFPDEGFRSGQGDFKPGRRGGCIDQAAVRGGT